MDFYNKYLSLCNNIGKAPSRVALDCGISKPSVNHWKNGYNPTDANLQKLADYFGVSVEYLRGTEEIKEPIQTTDRFSEMFYRLDNDDRQEIIDIMNMKLNKSKYQKENAG